MTPRGFSAYLFVLRRPGVPLLAVGAAIASLPIGLLGLALLLVMRSRGDAFTAGGLVVAGLGVGTVAGMLVQGRLIDRLGARRVLLPAVALRLMTGAAFLSLDHLPLPAAVALVAVVGLGEPQVSNALRALLPRLVDPGLRPAAAAVSALMFELPVLIGPLLLTALLVTGTPATAVGVGLVCSAIGAGLFAASRSAAPSSPGAQAVDRAGLVITLLGVPTVRRLVAVLAVQGQAVGMVQVAAVARASTQGSGAGAGILYAALTTGSLVGTAVAGSRWSRQSSAAGFAPLLLGLAVSAGAGACVRSLPLLVICLLGFGLCAGPVVLRCFVTLEHSAPDHGPTTAVTILVAAGLTATSAGTALAGWLVDASGPTAPLLLVTATLTTAALLEWVFAQRSRSAP